jgi:hypothetical protein
MYLLGKTNTELIAELPNFTTFGDVSIGEVGYEVKCEDANKPKKPGMSCPVRLTKQHTARDSEQLPGFGQIA